MKSLLVTVFALFTAAALADEFPSVQELMTEEDFEAAGLDRLTEEELASLRKWLWVYTERDSEFHRRNSKAPSAETVENAEDVTAIHTHIVGEFSGWEGQTRFELANGQIWEQRRRARHYQNPVLNPEVVIEKNLFGLFEMTVVGSGRTIQVRRIK